MKKVIVIGCPGSGKSTVGRLLDIAGYTFEYSKPFALYAYCEGVFTPLEEAYDNGVITQTHISQICEYHKTKRFDYGDYYENKEML